VGPLNLSPGESLLDMKVEAGQGKREIDRLGQAGGALRREGIDDVLMDEGRIAALQRIGAQLVVDVFFGDGPVQDPPANRETTYPMASTSRIAPMTNASRFELRRSNRFDMFRL
jgi:hypothetical protein